MTSEEKINVFELIFSQRSRYWCYAYKRFYTVTIRDCFRAYFKIVTIDEIRCRCWRRILRKAGITYHNETGSTVFYLRWKVTHQRFFQSTLPEYAIPLALSDYAGVNIFREHITIPQKSILERL